MTQPSPVARRATTLERLVAKVADACRSPQVGDTPSWNIGRGRPILSSMDDTPHHKHPAVRDPPMPSEDELLAALARSEADLASGRIVPASVVHEELSAALERIEARRGQRRGTVARR